MESVANLSAQVAVDFIESSLILLRKRDVYSEEHSKAVGRLSGELGKQLGLDLKTVRELEFAGRAHDIGKLAWHDCCFSDKGKEELGHHVDRMFSHPIHSRNFLNNSLQAIYDESNKCNKRWIYWVWFHHWGFTEKYRKTPPPEHPDVVSFLQCLETCPHRESIELGIGIIHVADSYHAGISGRSYRKDHPIPKSTDTVLGELQAKAGEEYHPFVVQKMVAMSSWLKTTFCENIYYQ